MLEVNEPIGEIAAEIFALLYKTGHHSGNYDIFLAAIALHHQMALCTNNKSDYQYIPELEMTNWQKE